MWGAPDPIEPSAHAAIPMMIQLEQISRTYHSDCVETAALSEVSLQIEAGEFVAVMGPSGCGKTTLLNLMGLLDTPTSGHYLFQGQDVTRATEKERAQLRKQHIGFIFQDFSLIDELTVAENIEMALLYQDRRAASRRRKVAAVMDQVGIAHRARHLPSQLSGGQQQRVSVARAVVAGQSLILADEPTGNLDSAHGQDVMDMLRSLNEDGTTIVMVTHSLAHADVARRSLHLFDGGLVTERLRSVTVR